jgi:hypothetical protein
MIITIQRNFNTFETELMLVPDLRLIDGARIVMWWCAIYTEKTKE